jgi:hypothetical protein
MAIGYVLMPDKPQPETPIPGSAPPRRGRRLIRLLAAGVALVGVAGLYL